MNTIRLYQFKNYRQQEFHFKESFVAITGPNGTGKTNLLDAIYYLGFTKSYFNGREKSNASHGSNSFRVEGNFSKNDKKENVSCVYRSPKKEISLNGVDYERLSRHIGLFPMVFIAPDDSILITGGSEQRRKFLDVLLSQIEPDYLDHLIAYQKIRSQRNSFLKNHYENRNREDLLKVFDQQLVAYGQPIFESRRHFLRNFSEKVQYYYRILSEDKESIAIQYASDLKKQPLELLLQNSRQQDYVLGYTTKGVHRDDLKFLMTQHPLKQIGSQGQKKSFVLALKLAQLEVLRKQKGFAPILLLDDIFEKLDQQRVGKLIALISDTGFDQVFITDTEAERMESLFKKTGKPLQMIKLF